MAKQARPRRQATRTAKAGGRQAQQKRAPAKETTQAKEAETVTYVTNPQSGRQITVDGPTFRQIVPDLTPSQYKSMMQTQHAGKKRGRTTSDQPVSNKRLKSIAAHKVAPKESIKETLERTYQPALRRRLQKQQEREQNPRGSRTRGWAARAPQKGRARHILHKQCGDDAFLMPDEEKFPIMAKCGDGKEADKCECEIDCGGVHSALVRARQWKYPHVADAAERLLRSKCGRQ